ncbi:MAG: alpha/beta hydrolase family protein [Burkholderiaceae bacterium]
MSTNRLARPLAAALAALAFLAAPPARAADDVPATRTGPHAGETARTTRLASAAPRNHGNAVLRVTVWYPAAASAAETPTDMGPPGRPIFRPGAVAADAPWADERRHPVVLVSHGFGGTARQMTWLGAALARAGYVAVAVDHPGTNGADGVTPEGAYAPWERTLDLRAALDLALADPALAPHLDAGRVGAAGFSLGGFTTALLAGARTDFDHFEAFCSGPQRDAICNPQKEFPLDFLREAPRVLAEPAMAPAMARRGGDLREPRVRAAFLVAPALGEAIAEASLADVHVPMEVVYGEADAIVPPSTNALRIAHGVAAATTLALPGVGHYDFLSECGAFGREAAADYCAETPSAPRARTHAQVEAAAVAFFDRTLR